MNAIIKEVKSEGNIITIVFEKLNDEEIVRLAKVGAVHSPSSDRVIVAIHQDRLPQVAAIEPTITREIYMNSPDEFERLQGDQVQRLERAIETIDFISRHGDVLREIIKDAMSRGKKYAIVSIKKIPPSFIEALKALKVPHFTLKGVLIVSDVTPFERFGFVGLGSGQGSEFLEGK